MTLLMRDRENVEKGIEQGKIQVVLTMLQEGFSKEVISKATGFSNVEIDMIQNNGFLQVWWWDESPRLKVFLGYAAGNKSDDAFVKELNAEIAKVRESKEWRREYRYKENTIKKVNNILHNMFGFAVRNDLI